MDADPKNKLPQEVITAYPADCWPEKVQFLGAAGGFSGARFFRLSTPRGPLCLRRWPQEHPLPNRLEFIHAVLWYAEQEGFDRVPVPVETTARTSYVHHAGHLWELAPWIPGEADYLRDPRPEKLRAALATLAEFHEAVASFPLAEPRPTVSPSIVARQKKLRDLMKSGLAQLTASLTPSQWPEFENRARRLLELFPLAAADVGTRLDAATECDVALQPCAGDIWYGHVLFDDEEVTGLIDFGAMKPENVSLDIARLLGSMAGNDVAAWQDGLEAYQEVRKISNDERSLVIAFDLSGVLMSGLNWIEWIYVQGRTFDNRQAILERLDGLVTRLEGLVD